MIDKIWPELPHFKGHLDMGVEPPFIYIKVATIKHKGDY